MHEGRDPDFELNPALNSLLNNTELPYGLRLEAKVAIGNRVKKLRSEGHFREANTFMQDEARALQSELDAIRRGKLIDLAEAKRARQRGVVIKSFTLVPSIITAVEVVRRWWLGL